MMLIIWILRKVWQQIEMHWMLQVGEFIPHTSHLTPHTTYLSVPGLTPLILGWQSVVDPSTGNTYYWELSTGKGEDKKEREGDEHTTFTVNRLGNVALMSPGGCECATSPLVSNHLSGLMPRRNSEVPLADLRRVHASDRNVVRTAIHMRWVCIIDTCVEWMDVLGRRQSTSLCYYLLVSSCPLRKTNMARELVREALNRGSSDNITVAVLFF